MKKLVLKKMEDVERLLEAHPGRIFRATFIKADRSVRVLVGRQGVTKDRAGGQLRYDPSQYGLLCVYDMQKEVYRNINLNTLVELKIGGQIFIPGWTQGAVK